MVHKGTKIPQSCFQLTAFCDVCTFLFKLFQADAPNPGLIPDADAVGVTVVLITCTYRGQEFIRVGYYVNNEYTETELRENPPVKPDFSKVMFYSLFHYFYYAITISQYLMKMTLK